MVMFTRLRSTTADHIIRRGEKLCTDLAAYAGQQRLMPADVELLPLLTSMAHLLRGTLDARIEVSVFVDPACTICRVDTAALEEALMELVVNARDAMLDGGRLSLGAAPVQIADATPGIAISVEDSGAGMPAEVATQAARPFYTTKTGHPGAGLGLSAVEGFARQSGGYLALQSSPGNGTKVTLFLRC
jgi:C4-dicarboxylate-specific signal transduction histidine kinase